jgi:hypothetical protein
VVADVQAKKAASSESANITTENSGADSSTEPVITTEAASLTREQKFSYLSKLLAQYSDEQNGSENATRTLMEIVAVRL